MVKAVKNILEKTKEIYEKTEETNGMMYR